jgi:hypothetical protein
MKQHLASILFLFAGYMLPAQNWHNPQPSGQGLEGITSYQFPLYLDYEQFGADVAISGEYAVAGVPGHDLDAQGQNNISNAGALYVYKKVNGIWQFYQKLVADDRVEGTGLGVSVAMQGDYIIAAASGAHAIYVFKLTTGVWQQQQKLQPANNSSSFSFGQSCDIDGNYIVVGDLAESFDANGQDSLQMAGAVYVFVQNNGVWSQQQKLVQDVRMQEGRFGCDVAISGDRIICGAQNEPNDVNGSNYIFYAGAAYIFKRTGNQWVQEQKLVNLDRSYYGWFGTSVDIDSNMAVVTAVGNTTDANNTNPIANMGAAYVFTNTPHGWVQQSKLVPNDRTAGSLFFGNAISISGRYIVVGMAQADLNYNRAGAAYIYIKNDRWEQQQKVTGYYGMEDYYFGTSVAIDGPNIIIGESGFSDVGNYTLVGDIYFFDTTALAISLQATATSCQSATDGTIKATVTGGYAPYTVTTAGHINSGSGTFYSLAAGTYTVTVTDGYGGTATQTITVNQGTQTCGGTLVMTADSMVNYLDTITVKVRIENPDNLFSVYSKLHFDESLLELLDYTQEGLFGTTNILTTPPVVTNGVLDFGITKTVGQPGISTGGAFYTFRFKFHDLPVNVPFFYQAPDKVAALFKLDNVTVYDATGLQRQLEMPAVDTTWLRYYVPVWPGDLNFDKKVNVADILPIGYFYNQSGPARPNASLQWIAQQAQLWGFGCNAQNASAYKTFADGNGNGLIDLADQSAIGFNLSKTHALNAPPAIDVSRSGNNPPISAEITPTQLDSTQLPYTLTIPIRAGSGSNSINNLYGVAFDLLFNPVYVDTNNIQLNFSNSVFGTQNVDYIRIEDLHPGQGRLSIGLTRYNSTELFCMGDELLSVTLTIKSQVPTGWFKATTQVLDANDLSGNDILLDGTTDSVYIITSIPNSVEQVEGNSTLTIYPNPATSGFFYITTKSMEGISPVAVQLITADGRIVADKTIGSKNTISSGRVDFTDIASGMYMVRITMNNGQTVVKKLCITTR